MTQRYRAKCQWKSRILQYGIENDSSNSKEIIFVHFKQYIYPCGNTKKGFQKSKVSKLNNEL